jgi:RNA polymerase sigma factor (sigma-70 family)
MLVQHLRRLAGQEVGQFTDQNLLASFLAQRDEAAFAALVERHGPMVWRICRRTLHNGHDAEDAFQATFLVLSCKAGSVRRQQSLASWLYGVALRVALKARKAASRRPGALPASPAARDADPLAAVSVREAQTLIDEELARLPEKYRAPLLLCCLEGSTRDEAARQLGWSPGLVKSRLEEGRQRLRRRLLRRGLPLPAALAAVLLAESVAPAATPPGLVDGTVKAALLVAAGRAVGSAASASVAALVHAAGRSASVWRILGLLAVTCCLVGVGVALHSTPMAEEGARKDGQPTRGPVDAAARADRHGDPLPDGAAARLGTLRWRPGEGIFLMAYTPDGKTLITQGWDAVTFWDVASGKALRRLRKPSGETLATMSVSGDGTRVLTVSAFKGIMDLWQVPTGQHLVRLGGPGYAAVLSPDGRTIASRVYDQPTIRLWDAQTGRELRQLAGHEGRLWTLAFSGDSRTLASGGSDKTIRFWDVATGKERYPPVRHSHSIGLLALSPDGRTVAAIDLYMDDGKTRYMAKGWGVHWWDVAGGKKRHQFPEKMPEHWFGQANFLGQSYGFGALTFSPDGKRLVTGETGPRYLILDVATGKEVSRLPETFSSSGRGVAFSPDGKRLATEVGNTIRFWEVATGKEMRAPSGGHPGAVNALAFTADGRRLVSGGSDGTLRDWDIGTGGETRPATDTGWWISSLAAAPDGRRVASAQGHHSLCVWHWAGLEPPRPLPQPVCDALAFSTDGKILAGASYKTVYLWDPATGRKLRALPEHPERVQRVEFSPDGRRLWTWDNAKMAHVWELATGKELRRLACPGRDTQREPGAFSPKGRLFAWAERYAPDRPGRIRLFDLAHGYEIRQLPGPRSAYTCLAFSPDGRTLAAADQSGTQVHCWEVASGRERRKFVGHRGQVNALAFSPDGTWLASGSEDTTVLVWNVYEVPGREGPPSDRRALWGDLAGPDAGCAFGAVAQLVAAPEHAVALLRECLAPAPPLDPKRMARLLADLGDDRFAVRERASAELRELGPAVRPVIERALGEGPALEVRRRLEALREKIDRRPLGGDALRAVRAVEVLERIGSDEAREVLRGLARGSADALLTQQASAALEQLARPSSAR